MFSKIKYFISNHPVSSVSIGIIVILLLFGIFTCAPGTIHASDNTYQIDDAIYIPVAGIYEITKGVQIVKDGTGTEKTDLTGYVFPVNQNTWIVESLDCLSYLRKDGFAGCGGSESYTFDGWYGVIQSITSGAMTFHKDGTMEMETQVSGVYIEQNYSFTVYYNLEAKLKDFDE